MRFNYHMSRIYFIIRKPYDVIEPYNNSAFKADAVPSRSKVALELLMILTGH